MAFYLSCQIEMHKQTFKATFKQMTHELDQVPEQMSISFSKSFTELIHPKKPMNRG